MVAVRAVALRHCCWQPAAEVAERGYAKSAEGAKQKPVKGLQLHAKCVNHQRQPVCVNVSDMRQHAQGVTGRTVTSQVLDTFIMHLGGKQGRDHMSKPPRARTFYTAYLLSSAPLSCHM